MGFELGQTYSEYEFLDVVKRSRSIIAYRVRNVAAERLELLQVLPQTAQEDAEQVERFFRETRLRAGLQHPNIASFYNAAHLEGQWIMTTELVEGPTLADRLQSGPLPWPQAVGLAVQALSALSYAHEHSIIHRDISAESIVVTTDGTVKLSQFALAKASNGPQLTQAGAIIGNLRYISPEQIRGYEVDARSDIYSLGIVLYEMLCGAPPFDSRSQFELMLAHVNRTPLPPSMANHAVPAELDGVVLKALAKNPEERFQSAAEFAEALLAVGLGGSDAPAETAPAAEALPPAPVTEDVAPTAPEPIDAEPVAEPNIEAILEPPVNAAVQTTLELPPLQPAAELAAETAPEIPHPVPELPAEPVGEVAVEPEAQPDAAPVSEPVPQPQTAEIAPEPVFVPFALLAPPAPPIEPVVVVAEPEPAVPDEPVPETVAALESPEPAPAAIAEPEVAVPAEPAPEPVAALESPEPTPPEPPELEPVLAAVHAPKQLGLQWAIVAGGAAGIAAMAVTIWLMSGT